MSQYQDTTTAGYTSVSKTPNNITSPSLPIKSSLYYNIALSQSQILSTRAMCARFSADVTHFPKSVQRDILFEDKDLAIIVTQNIPQNTRELVLSSFKSSERHLWHGITLVWNCYINLLRMDNQSYLNFSILAFSSSCMSWTARHHSSSPADHPEACTAHLHCPPVNYPFFLSFFCPQIMRSHLYWGEIWKLPAAQTASCLGGCVCNYKGVYSKIFTSNATAPKFLSF